MSGFDIARSQFGVTIMFHYLFLPFIAGLSFFMMIFYLRNWTTGNPLYQKLSDFWTRIFIIFYAFTIVTGILLQLEMESNWKNYSLFIHNIKEPLLNVSGFLSYLAMSFFAGILLFFRHRLSASSKFFLSVLLFISAVGIGYYIIFINSWMHMPHGLSITVKDGRQAAQVNSQWDILMNTGAFLRFTHVTVGSIMQAGIMILSISAYYLLRKIHVEFAKKAISSTLVLITCLMLFQAFVGHKQGQMLAHSQPVKIAALEGHYRTQEGAPAYIIGITNPEKEHTYGISIKGLLSFLAFNDSKAKVTGLNEFPKNEWPDVGMVFLSFHAMVGIGISLIVILVFSSFMLFSNRLFHASWLLKILVFLLPLPFIANELGWLTTERGRQPWVIQNVLKSADAYNTAADADFNRVILVIFSLIALVLAWLCIRMISAEIKSGPNCDLS